MGDKHIHAPGDGRGLRKVYCNGKELGYCFYAGTIKEIAACFRYPYKQDRWKKRLVSDRYRGSIEVEFMKNG